MQYLKYMRLQQFITKYKDSIQVDSQKEIHCGIINLDELHIAAQLLQAQIYRNKLVKIIYVIPNNKVAFGLLEKAIVPVAALSVNLFTHKSPTSVYNDFMIRSSYNRCREETYIEIKQFGKGENHKQDCLDPKINSLIITFNKQIQDKISIQMCKNLQQLNLDLNQEIGKSNLDGMSVYKIIENKYTSLSLNYYAKETMFNLYDSLR